MEVTWDDFFATLAPQMLRGVHEADLHDTLHEIAEYYGEASATQEFPDDKLDDFKMTGETILTVTIQLRALGLIAPIENNEWELTPYGDNYMTKLIAIPKQPSPNTTGER